MGIRRRFSSRVAKMGAALVVGCCGGFFLCSCATESLSVKRTSRSYSRYMMGLLNDRLGSPEEAAAFFQQAQDLDHRAPAPHLKLGFDYIQLKKYQEAVDELQKAVQLAPDDEYARYVLAMLYVHFEDFKKASLQYEKLLEGSAGDRTQNIQLRHVLSQLYFLQGDLSSSLGQCREILRLDPLDTASLYMAATIYSETGQIQKAIETFREVLAHDPDNAEAMNSLAYTYAQEGIELDKALVLAEKALESDPANGAFLDTLGWVYFKIGETDKAIEFLESASKLMLDPAIFNHLAQACYQKGRRDEAKKHWKSSFALDPGQKDVRAYLKMFDAE